jgi:hypothetical protein
MSRDGAMLALPRHRPVRLLDVRRLRRQGYVDSRTVQGMQARHGAEGRSGDWRGSAGKVRSGAVRHGGA